MRRFAYLIGSIVFCLPSMAFAAQSFGDVPTENPHYTAIEYLEGNGILAGYADGTFHPTQTVNRAEVMKIVTSLSADTGSTFSSSGSSSFKDVDVHAWYSLYVEKAYTQLRIIDGPPLTSYFHPEKPVTRAEFLKMLLLAQKADPVASYSEITYPLASDVTSTQDWFYPYIRFGISAAMVEPMDGKLAPSQTLTRGDIAEMLYRFLQYRAGKQTQTLLSDVENNVLSALQLATGSDIALARYSAARAIIAARGALASSPGDATVKAAVKTAEGTMALVDAADAISRGDKQTTLDQTNTAWHLGAKALEFSSALKQLDIQLQDAATKMAYKARSSN